MHAVSAICPWATFLVYNIWVDDLLIFTTQDVLKPLCDHILARFNSRFEGEIGEIGKVLGMEIMRDRPSRTMTTSHRMKIKDLLDSNGMKVL